MNQYILVMDLGTTSRDIVFDNKGSIISVAQKEFTQYLPEPEWVDHYARMALLVLGIGLFPGGSTGYSTNPTRDLASRILHWILTMNVTIAGYR